MAKIFVENFVFQPKRKTAAEWESENPILRDGEFGVVTDGSDGEWLKVGDGVTAWNSLPYKKGPKGDPGAQGLKGDKGDKGDKGEAPKIQDGTWWLYNNSTGLYENTGVAVSSDYELTKAKVENVLTGEISSHTHDYSLDAPMSDTDLEEALEYLTQ